MADGFGLPGGFSQLNTKAKIAHKDVVDRSALNDPAYVAAVREIQAESNIRAGYLLGASRQDVQFLSDFQEQERRKEQDQLEMEKALFSQLRSGDPVAAGESAEGAQVVRVAVREKKDIRPAAKLLPIVRVVPAGAGSSLPRSTSLSKSSSLKAGGASGELIQRQASTGGGGGEEDERVAKRHKSGQLTSPQGSADAAKLAAMEEEKEEDGGLQQLLGGYGSSSEDEGGQQGQGEQGRKTTSSTLPDAAQLLEGIARHVTSQKQYAEGQANTDVANSSPSGYGE